MSAFYIRYPAVNIAPGALVIADQGSPAAISDAWPIKITDAVNEVTLLDINVAQAVVPLPGWSQPVLSVMAGWDGTYHREALMDANGNLTVAQAGLWATRIEDSGGGTITAISGKVQVIQPDVIATGVITSNQSVTLAVNGLSSAGLDVSGTWTGTITIEASIDGITFYPAQATTLTGGLIFSNLSANNVGQMNVSGFVAVRLRGNTVLTGSATVTIRGNATTGPIILSEPLPNGGNTIGLVGQSGSPWGMNQTQVGGVAVTLGQKVSASSYPVVLASDQSSVSFGPSKGRAFSNVPVRNDYTSVNVTTGAYVQLVASTTSTTNLIDVFDSSGQTMALAVGAAASEVIQFYITPGGQGQVPLAIPAGSRVSIKAISATAAVGEIDINFWG